MSRELSRTSWELSRVSRMLSRVARELSKVSRELSWVSWVSEELSKGFNLYSTMPGFPEPLRAMLPLVLFRFLLDLYYT